MTEDDTFEALQLHVVIDNDGAKFYYNRDNQLHRVYGPAVIRRNGDKHWYINGKRHREDGPAGNWHSGTLSWFIHGKRHRTDGPAFIFDDCSKEYWLDNEELNEAEFLKHPLCTIK